MPSTLTLPENYKIVDGSAGPVTTNGGVTADYVSLKDVKKAYILANFRQAASHASVLQPTMATAVAGTGVTSVTALCRVWKNADVSLTDTLVEAAAAASAACATGTTNQMIVMEIDPVELGAAGYDVLGCGVATSSQATNFVQITYLLEMSYKQATPPSQIID
jgi:hypothetical protein